MKVPRIPKDRKVIFINELLSYLNNVVAVWKAEKGVVLHLR